MMRALAIAVCACALAAGCDKLQGFGGPVPPLTTITVEATGDITPFQPPGIDNTPNLHVALIWGMQWLPEALCILPPANADAQAIIGTVDAPGPGCRDSFGFVPLRVEANVAVEPGVPATIELSTLPGADVLVGDVTARTAYGSLVVYDDRNGDGTLTIARANRLGNAGGSGSDTGSDDTPTTTEDIVYGGSFISMTEPDHRLAYREGAFDAAAAFYPRAGCAAPPPAFSIVAASGFTVDAAIAATISGMLPPETDVSQCAAASPPDTTVTVDVQAPANIAELACTENNADSSVRYREPKTDSPDLTGRMTACVPLPTFGGSASTQTELIVTGVVNAVAGGPAIDACRGLTHYVLKGCSNDPNCGVPSWDHSLAPPTWWPCAQ